MAMPYLTKTTKLASPSEESLPTMQVKSVKPLRQKRFSPWSGNFVDHLALYREDDPVARLGALPARVTS